jgi:hypothetical protein
VYKRQTDDRISIDDWKAWADGSANMDGLNDDVKYKTMAIAKDTMGIIDDAKNMSRKDVMDIIGSHLNLLDSDKSDGAKDGDQVTAKAFQNLVSGANPELLKLSADDQKKVRTAAANFLYVPFTQQEISDHGWRGSLDDNDVRDGETWGQSMFTLVDNWFGKNNDGHFMDGDFTKVSGNGKTISGNFFE